MNGGLFSLYWDNIDERIVRNQKNIFDHFKIPIKQHRIDGLDHGEWMDWVMSFYDMDVILFVDIDCVPLNAEIVMQSLEKAANGILFGAMGCANHLDPGRVFAAPFWCAINRHQWIGVNRPSAKANRICDVAQNWTDAFGMSRQKIEFLPVTDCEQPKWNLPDVPTAFGIGTTYGHAVYHLFESRSDRNVERFVSKCEGVFNYGAEKPLRQAVNS
ncbi:MAG: hypothetical protein WCF20_15085 [Methylovirgula sp.]